MRITIITVFSLLLQAGVASAALGPIPGEEKFSGLHMSPETSGSGGAELGLSQIGEDWFVTVTPRLDLNFGKIGVGLQVPLNLRVKDDDPQNENDYGGIIREEDWDETSEYLRAIRYLRYGHKNDDLFFRVGELAAEIGHGTIMSRYLNNLDVNTFRLGMQFDLNTNYGGFETVINDIGKIADSKQVDSRIVGGRLYVKPMALLVPDSLLNIFQLGVSAVTDLNAPYALERVGRVDDNGAPVLDVEGVQYLDPVVTDGKFGVASDRQATVWGVDAAVELLRSPILDITPYTDLNFVTHAGWGWHAGVAAVAKFPIGLDLAVPIRLEYRRFKNNYMPAYFSTFYEVERYSFLSGDSSKSKSRFIRDKDGDKGINGYYADLAFDFSGIVQVGGILEAYDNIDNYMSVFLSVPALETVQFKAYYARTGITDKDDVFVLDDRSLVIAQGRYEVFTFTYLVMRWTRQWTLDETSAKYESEDSWKAGLEFNFDF